MTTDEQLLRAYIEGRSEAAFTELVRRHVDLVYSTALRTVRERPLAQDVTQAVFIHLARKAGAIRNPSALPGWLYRVACDQAANAVRAERRRRQREREAMKMNSTTSEETPAWTEIAPLLEEAMRTLARRDQDAVVLRFFHGQSLRQVGETLQLSEDAAQKRLSRALERLRGYFARRGVKVSAGVLASSLAAHAVQAAPSAVGPAVSAAVLTSSAALKGAGVLGLAKIGFTKGLILTTAQKVAVTAIVTVAVGTTVFEVHRAGQRTREQEAGRQVGRVTQQANQLRQGQDQGAAGLNPAGSTVKRPPSLTLKAYADSGFDLLLNKRDFAGARAIFEAVLQEDPDYADAYHGLAIVRREAGDPASALPYHDRAIQLAPERADYYWWQGVTYQRLNDQDAAIKAFEQGLEAKDITYRRPGLLEIGLAQSYRAKGDLEKALAYNEQAIALYPQIDWIYKDRGNTYLALGEQERAEVDFAMSRELQGKPR